MSNELYNRGMNELKKIENICFLVLKYAGINHALFCFINIKFMKKYQKDQNLLLKE